MQRHHRILTPIRIVVLILVGLAFLIARLAKAQEQQTASLQSTSTLSLC